MTTTHTPESLGWRMLKTGTKYANDYNGAITQRLSPAGIGPESETWITKADFVNNPLTCAVEVFGKNAAHHFALNEGWRLSSQDEIKRTLEERERRKKSLASAEAALRHEQSIRFSPAYTAAAAQVTEGK